MKWISGEDMGMLSIDIDADKERERESAPPESPPDAVPLFTPRSSPPPRRASCIIAPRSSLDSRRLGVCVFASLALHALVLALLPPPADRKSAESQSILYIDLRDSRSSAAFQDFKADRDTPAPSTPSKPEALKAPEPPPPEPLPANAVSSVDAVESLAPPEPSRVVDQAAPQGESALPADTEGGAAESETAMDGESLGPNTGASPENEAARLLLARVEAALEYPETARRRGLEGVTGLLIELDRDGSLAALRITRSSGSSLLDRAARDAVLRSLPVPNPLGRPLSFALAVRFELTKKGSPQNQ